MKNSKYKIYVDLDGVVADFDAKVSEITNGESQNSEFPNSKLWAAVYRYDKDVEPFFVSLPKMADADKLINFITDNFEFVTFLTATGSTPRDAARQKKQWANNAFPGIDVIAVQKSAEKAVYANPRTILVDDREQSIGPWVRAGGVGILFTDASQAISELQKVL